MKKPRAKSINSRQKGKRIEREACKFLETITGEKWERTSQHCGKSRDSADIRPVDPKSMYAAIHFEVKGDKSIDVGTKALDDACAQAARDSAGKKWVVLWKPKGKGWRLTTRVSTVGTQSSTMTSTVTFGSHGVLDYLAAITNTFTGAKP